MRGKCVRNAWEKVPNDAEVAALALWNRLAGLGLLPSVGVVAVQVERRVEELAHVRVHSIAVGRDGQHRGLGVKGGVGSVKGGGRCNQSSSGPAAGWWGDMCGVHVCTCVHTVRVCAHVAVVVGWRRRWQP